MFTEQEDIKRILSTTERIFCFDGREIIVLVYHQGKIYRSNSWGGLGFNHVSNIEKNYV